MVDNAEDDIPCVVEIIRRINEGSTQPFLCRCNDDRLYVVKSRPSMPPRNLLAEFVSGCIVEDIGLPIPDFKIVNIPEEVIEYVPDLEQQISPGPAFASLYIEGAASLTFSQSRDESVIPVDEQKLIYVIDKTVLNADRTLTEKGGNVNILYDFGNSKYYLIDHNLSFDQNASEADFSVHVYAPNSRNWRIDMVDKLELRERILETLRRMPHFLDDIPDEWIDDAFFPVINNTLDRTDTDEFWSTLE
ncbi:HipA family kinase [Serratia ureilytica]|uniref:HipA family kinase n=1 Tax=Serratia ureilytica TaxID=300181 RepID=UPI001D17E17A|nr:HipA family kinase [Serratia ureilytica]MCC4105042.1 hypothetical protein [Serratia ureilytica]